MLSFILPHSGASLAEFIQVNGYDVVIGYDDFSVHAKVQRSISLLSTRIPSKDAFPSDMFNIHSALLERSAKIKFSGTFTALPIVETINSDISEQVATNVISITDGQIYTSSQLFKNGYRPAIHSAVSVSRVGSTAQFKLLSKLVGKIKNDLSQYRSQIESSQMESTYEDIEIRLLRVKGRALESMFSQDWLDGSNIEETTVILFLQNKGFLTQLTTEQFNKLLLPLMRFLCSEEFLQFEQLILITKHHIGDKVLRLVERFVLLVLKFFIEHLIANKSNFCLEIEAVTGLVSVGLIAPNAALK